MGNLAETHPHLAAQWHPSLNGEKQPWDFTAGSSSYKAFWICEVGHTWRAVIFSRSKGSGCPYCSNQSVWEGYNDLASQNPDVAKEWDYQKNSLTPTEVVVKSTKRVWWMCSQGHSWIAQISSRTAQGTGCPYCSGVKILSGFNDLESLSPHYLSEWNYDLNELKPNEVGPSTGKKVWWTCPAGHDYESKLVERSRGYGCPYCSSKKVLSGFNDFESQFPELARFWDEEKNGISASLVAKSSSKSAWFKCDLGHSFKSSANSITGRGKLSSGCPVCSGRKLLKGFNDLATLAPEVAKLWHPSRNSGLTPNDVTKASTRKVWWKCLSDVRHEWQSTVASRSNNASRGGGNGCPFCSSRIVMEGFNDLFTVAPDLKSEWHTEKNGDLSPASLSAETPKKVWWRCKQDGRHEWVAQVDTRVKRGSGCPICSNKKTVTGLNDMATTHPRLAREFDVSRNQVLPNSVNAGDHKTFWWNCPECKVSWKASPSNRSRVNSGCPRCSKTGYDPTSNGYLYLLRKSDEGLQQFGITNVPKKRTARHKRNGWEVLDIVGPADGYWVFSTETALKLFFDSRGLLLPRDYPDKFDGYTETWESSNLGFNSLSDLLSALRQFEDELTESSS